MDSSQALSQAKALAERFVAPSGEAHWDQFLGVSTWSWASDLLSQLVALIGDQDVLYASGYVTDDGAGPHADVVVFTTGAVIEGGYGPREPGAARRAWARGTTWRLLGAIRVNEAGPLVMATDAEWPRRLEVEFEYVPMAQRPPRTLPVEPAPRAQATDALSAFLPTLLAGLGK